MNKKEFHKRISQCNAAIHRTQEEMKNERLLEATQLMRDEVMPRFTTILKELAPSITAWQAYQNALEGSMKPMESERYQ